MAVATGHAARLMESHGFEAEIVLTKPDQAQHPRAAAGVPVRRMKEVVGREYDLAIGTWWTTATALFEMRARRRVMFLQSLEHRFYTEDDYFERFGALSVLGLPVDYLVVASYMTEVLARLRPDARCRLVPNGIDKSVFAVRRRQPENGPLRVLVEGQPELWFKGVTDAVRAVRSMREPVELTLVALEASGPYGLPVDRVVAGLTPARMAELYAEHDVLVKFSRFEGLPLPPLEAFHAGVPCIVTPFTGHADYVEHGGNGLIVGFDDPGAATEALDLLARDRALLARLSHGALATAQAWPGAAESSGLLADALTAFATEPPADPRLAPLMRMQRLAVELSREYVRRAALREQRQIAELKDSRAYRLAVGLRSLAGREHR